MLYVVSKAKLNLNNNELCFDEGNPLQNYYFGFVVDFLAGILMDLEHEESL